MVVKPLDFAATFMDWNMHIGPKTFPLALREFALGIEALERFVKVNLFIGY